MNAGKRHVGLTPSAGGRSGAAADVLLEQVPEQLHGGHVLRLELAGHLLHHGDRAGERAAAALPPRRADVVGVPKPAARCEVSSQDGAQQIASSTLAGRT